MLKEDELMGIIGIYRQEVRPFTDKQIELVENFAAQAVIAIENTRLLNELREIRCSSRPPPPRCCKVIISSPGELQPVFETMLANAQRAFARQVRPYVPMRGRCCSRWRRTTGCRRACRCR